MINQQVLLAQRPPIAFIDEFASSPLNGNFWVGELNPGDATTISVSGGNLVIAIANTTVHYNGVLSKIRDWTDKYFLVEFSGTGFKLAGCNLIVQIINAARSIAVGATSSDVIYYSDGTTSSNATALQAVRGTHTSSTNKWKLETKLGGVWTTRIDAVIAGLDTTQLELEIYGGDFAVGSGRQMLVSRVETNVFV